MRPLPLGSCYPAHAVAFSRQEYSPDQSYLYLLIYFLIHSVTGCGRDYLSTLGAWFDANLQSRITEVPTAIPPLSGRSTAKNRPSVMATETFTKPSSSFSLPVQGAVVPKRRDVTTVLNYYKDPGDGSPPTPVYVGGATVTNERPIAPTQVVIHDVFGEEEKYMLDTHGFQFIKHKSIGEKFNDEEWVTTAYYQESAEVYKNM